MPSSFPFKKVLIINIFGLGDVLFTTPLISNLKSAQPGIFIGYLCNKRTAPLLSSNPKVDKIFIYEKDDYREIFKQSKTGFLKRALGDFSQIKAEHFDAAIDISLNKYASFFLWLAGIKKRVGFNYKNRSPFLTEKIKLEGYDKKPVADYYLDLLSYLSVPIKSRRLETFTTKEDDLWAREALKNKRLSDQGSFVALVPGGGASWGKDAPYKRWPAEKYAKLADKIVEKFKAKIILLGDSKEEELCRRVAALMGGGSAISFNNATIGQFTALLKNCRLAVVNDGGPLHIAAAAGVKTVSIFGPVDENIYGPYPQENHEVVTKDIPCRPCYRRFRRAECEHISCLNTITIEEVLERLGRLL